MHMRCCLHCATAYDWRRSGSRWLKMTYCGVICERADLGFTIEGLLAAPRFRPVPEWPRNLLEALWGGQEA